MYFQKHYSSEYVGLSEDTHVASRTLVADIFNRPGVTFATLPSPSWAAWPFYWESAMYVELILGGPLDGAMWFIDDPCLARITIPVGYYTGVEYVRVGFDTFAFAGYVDMRVQKGN